MHHVFGRGNHKQPIFHADADRARFLHRLLALQAEMRFRLYAYCLMDNHYHLLIETGPTPMSQVMHRLLTGYSILFNDKTESTGHVFQGRYGDRYCADDAYFLWLIRYIHLNPVEAGLVGDPADWLWSSHRDYRDGRSSVVSVERALAMFASGKEFDDFIRQRPRDERTSCDMASLTDSITRELSVDRQAVRRRGGPLISQARRKVARLAVERGVPQAEIAAFLNCTQGAVSRLSRK